MSNKITSSSSRDDQAREQMAKARRGGSKSVQQSHHTQQKQSQATAAQSIEQLQQAQGDFQNFQEAIAAQLQAMQQATIATARQAAEIKNSMPLLFEQEFAARDAELRGAAQAGFPQPQFEPIAAFEVPETPRLIAAGGNANQRTTAKAIAPGASAPAG